MKYLFFFNCQLLLLWCVCFKFAIQDFVQENRQKYMEEILMVSPTDCHPSVFHRELRENYRIVPQSPTAILTDWHPQYFIESWEKITKLCHTHQRIPWRFAYISKRMHVRGVVSRHVYRWICHHIYWRNYHRHIYRQISRRIEKSGGIFEIFWCEYKFITDGNYRRNLMPPTIINVPSVKPSEKLLYKTPLPPFVSFFLSALHFSSPLRLYLVFGRDFIVLVVVLNILKGMYSFFFIFVFFLF